VELEIFGCLPMVAIVPDGYPQRRPFLTLVDRGGFSTNAEFTAANQRMKQAVREAQRYLVFEALNCVSGRGLLQAVSMHHCDLEGSDQEDALRCIGHCLGPPEPDPDSDVSSGTLSWPVSPPSPTGSMVTTSKKKFAKTDPIIAGPLRLGPARTTGTRDYAKNWPHVFDDESDSSSSESSSEEDTDSEADVASVKMEADLVWAELQKNIRQCRAKQSDLPKNAGFEV